MTDISICAVGDVLMWAKQIQAARMADGAYSFHYVFEEVSDHLKQADLTIGNLETTLSGREANYVPRQTVRRWPMFNCPDELAEALRVAGFHVMTTANNHCLDRGEEGLKRTLDVLDQQGIKHTGTFRSYRESEEALICSVKGVKVGLLAFTYGTNGMPIPNDKPWMVNFIQHGMLKKINVLKSKVDLTIVCLHFGVEHVLLPGFRHRSWAQACFEHGADVILGAHPHVLQPMEFRKVRDRDGVEKRRFIIYSLGNFASAPMTPGIRSVAGIILRLKASKYDNGRTEVSGAEYIPTWTNSHPKSLHGRYKVLLAAARLDRRPALSKEERGTAQKVWSHVTSHLASGPRRRPLWSPFELATVTSGAWLRHPSRRWWPTKVRVLDKPPPGHAAESALNGDIVFVRTEALLQDWFSNGGDSGSTSAGSLIVPPSLAASAHLPADRAVLVVHDPVQALRALAMHARTRMRGKVALIAGNVGATATGRMLMHAVHARGPAISDICGQSGSPLLLQEMASAPEDALFAVFEHGAGQTPDSLGEICSLLRPDVVVLVNPDAAEVTRPASSSASRRGAVRSAASRTLSLVRELRLGGTVVLNTGTPHYEELRAQLAVDHTVVSFGEDPGSDLHLVEVGRAKGGTEISASIHGKGLTYRIPSSDPSTAVNSLAALAAARELGLDVHEAANALGSYGSPPQETPLSRPEGVWLDHSVDLRSR